MLKARFGDFQIISDKGKTKVTLGGREISPSILWFLPSPAKLLIELLGLVSLIAWIIALLTKFL